MGFFCGDAGGLGLLKWSAGYRVAVVCELIPQTAGCQRKIGERKIGERKRKSELPIRGNIGWCHQSMPSTLKCNVIDRGSYFDRHWISLSGGGGVGGGGAYRSSWQQLNLRSLSVHDEVTLLTLIPLPMLRWKPAPRQTQKSTHTAL